MLFSLGQFRVKIILGNNWCCPENSKIELGYLLMNQNKMTSRMNDNYLRKSFLEPILSATGMTKVAKKLKSL